MQYLLLISFLFPNFKVHWKSYKRLKKFETKILKKRNPILAPTFMGPEGGIILHPISSSYSPRKVVAPSFFEYHKCEDVFLNDTFEIAIPYGLNTLRLGRIGVMTGNNRFVLVRDSISYYFTQDNFSTIDTLSFSSKILAIDSKADTVYIIVGDSLLKSVDGGQNFVFVNDLENYIIPGDYRYVMDVYPFDSDVIAILAIGPGGEFFYSTDGGLNFSHYPYPDTSNPFTLRFVHKGNSLLFAITENGGIRFTVDGGATWSSVNIVYTPPYPVMPLFGFDLLPLDIDTFIFSSILDRGIYKVYSTFGGWAYSLIDTSFQPFYFEPIYKNLSLYDTFYIGSNDGIYYTTDRGNTWTRYKNRLKATLIMGSSQISLKRDTLFTLTTGGVLYRGYRTSSSDLALNQLSFKGNLMFWGNNMVENYFNSPGILYLITLNVRLLDPDFYRVLYFSSNYGNTFSLISKDTALISFKDIIAGKNQNIFYLWNEDSIIKTTDGGQTFSTIFVKSGNIDEVTGEGDTLFLLTNTDSIFASYDGGNSFNFLITSDNAEEIHYLKNSQYLFFNDTLNNSVRFFNLLSPSSGIAISSPSPSHILINFSPSEDNYIYAFYYDTLNSNYEIYYRLMPDGPVISAPVNGITMPMGILALKKGYLLIYEMGRGVYMMSVTDIKEKVQKRESEIKLLSYFGKEILVVWRLNKRTPYSLLDVCGRKIKGGFLNKNKNFINLKFLKGGVYYIKIGNSKFKFIKF